ncbi:MAG TPA: TadE family protein [Nocardioides sp.]|uniref:TadE family protein n=1 Tax=Nocardioides sp. TaxID=35761 RepID=UPI002ED8BE92
MRRRAFSGPGGAALQAATVAPLLVVIGLGVAELAALARDNVALTSLAREGGRTATTTQADAGAAAEGPAPAVAAAVRAIQHAGPRLPKGAVEELWIYRADAAGYPLGTGRAARFTECRTDCVVYRWDRAAKEFVLAGGDWSTDLSRCAERSASSLGVYLKADHRFLTHAVTGSTAISHHAVFPIGPSHRCPDRG